MAKLAMQRVSELRRLLQNPYAYIEHLEEREADETSYRAASAKEIKSSRKRLENQYAHISESGFDAVAKVAEGGDVKPQPRHSTDPIVVEASAGRPRRGWSDRQIEHKARALQRLMWHKRASIWESGLSDDPAAVLDPEVALQVLNYECKPVNSIGIWDGPNGMVDVAGQIDTVNKVVLVADQFSKSARKFTTAHELGHAVLHPNLGVQHQDKLLTGTSGSQDSVEREASRFATFFLMPEKLLRKRFEAYFLTQRFELSEDTAFALAGSASAKLLSSIRSVRQLTRLLAGAPSYNGRHFDPLHVQFGVSLEAMAIRLEELSLV